MEDFPSTEKLPFRAAPGLPTSHHLPPTTSPDHHHNRIRAHRITNLNCDRDPSLGNACGDAGVDLQNSLHQSGGGSGVKDLSGLVVDENLYRKKRFRIRQVRSDFAILPRRICLSCTCGVQHYDGTWIGWIVPGI